MNPSLKRWIWLLNRTVLDNSWRHLSDRFIIDESYLRELIDTIDYVNDHDTKISKQGEIKLFIAKHQNKLYELRQMFAVRMYKKQRATEKDIALVFQMIKRSIHFKEFDEELMGLVKGKQTNLEDSFRRTNDVSQIKPEIKTPYNIQRLVNMMLDDDASMASCMASLKKEATNHLVKTTNNKGLWRTALDLPRPSIWEDSRWKSEFNAYKYMALNHYLIDKVEQGLHLKPFQVKAIRYIWEVDVASALEIFPNVIGLEANAW